MQELIKITKNNEGQQLVSAKELYIGLGLNKAVWARWSKANIIENDFFDENLDWIGVQHDVEGNKTMDFAISLEFAKHIAMMARTEKSHQYRQYFIECEKKLQQLNIPSYEISDPIERAKRWIEEEQVRQSQAKQLEEQKPLVQFANKVAGSSDCIDIGTFAKLIQDEGIKMGRNKLFNWLRENKYLMKDNMPYQQYIDREYFEVKEYIISSLYGDKVKIQTLLTGKGQIYFTEKLRSE